MTSKIFSEQGRSQAILERAFLDAPYPIVIFEGAEQRVTYINDALLQVWGKNRSVVGKTYLQIFPEIKNQAFPALLDQVFKTGITQTDTEAVVFLKVDGITKKVYFDYSYTAIRDEHETIIGVLVICRDVTERVLAKRTAIDSEAMFRNTITQAPVAIAVLRGPDFILEIANDKSLEMWGKTSEIIGKKIEEIFPEYKDQGFLDILSEVFNTGKAFYGNEVLFNIAQVDGYRPVYSNFVYQPVFEDGIITSIIALGYDVTELVQSRKTAENREALLELLNLAGKELALSSNTDAALQKIADLIVPKFADWFVINVLKGENLDALLVKTNDPEHVKWAYEYRKKWPQTIHDTGIQGHVLSSGEASLVPLISAEFLDHTIEDAQQNELRNKIGLCSSIITPMKIGNEIIGSINFISTDKGRQYTDTDLNFAIDFAARIALALENARLYEKQTESLENNKRLLREVEFERNRFEAIMMQMPGSVIIAEAPSGKLIFANEKINSVWGHPLKKSGSIEEYREWLGFHPDNRPYEAHEWPLARSIQNGEIVTDEDISIIRGDGKRAILRLSSAPIFNGAGKIIAGVVISQDVTLLKEAIKSRDEFLSIASHELKTPLTAVISSIQMLIRSHRTLAPSTDTPLLLDLAYKSAVKLNRLIQELLDVSKIEAGQLKLTKAVFNLADLVDECCSFVKVTKTHNITLKGDLGTKVLADQERIDQVIVNLVNNAVKYSPHSPEITITIQKQGNEVQLSITDMGIGIEEEKLPHLFKRYYRAENTGIQFSGFGLGLYICAEIIKLHGGAFGVKSTFGLGSTFWFTIPIDDI